MRVTQVNERVKESPASALRAMFAGIGSLLFVRDKVKSKRAGEAAAPETTAVPETSAAPETTAVPEVTAVPAVTTVPEVTAVREVTAVPEDTAAPEVAIASEVTATPEDTATPDVTAIPEDAAAPEGTSIPDGTAALPLANYDALTIASLRARLRNLSAAQLTQLIDYEKTHANRADVVIMFERRITKLNLGLTQALPKVTE